jgi:hypothetical protein
MRLSPYPVKHVTVESLDEGEGEVKLQGAAVFVETKVVPERGGNGAIFPEIERGDFTIPQVGRDVRIVIGVPALRDSEPGFENEVERILLKAEVRHEPVPAPREGLPAAVGLVIEADLDEPVSHETENVGIGAEVQKDLRLIVGLAEGRGKVRVVDLP